MPGSVGGGRRPPTIELQATEVASGPAAAQAPPGTAAEEPDVERPAEAARPASAPRSDLPSEPPSEPPHGSPPGPPPGGGRPGIAWLPPDLPWRLIGAGAGGVLAILLLLWATGPWQRPPDPMVAVGPKLNAIETQLRELATRPQPSGLDPKQIDELAARLAKLETTVAAPRPPTPDAAVLSRLTATDDAVKALAANITQLARRTDAIAASLAELQNAARASGADRSEIAALVNRIAALERSNQTVRDDLAGKIAALEQSNQAIRDDLAKRVAASTSNSASDRAVRLAMLASALRGAVERGDPFAAELAAVKPLAADGTALAALEPFAAKGVPGHAMLARELENLIEPLRRAAAAPPRDGGFIERLQANAQKLIRIRPVDEIPGVEPAAILSRVEANAARADVDGALAELAKLPSDLRVPAQGWIAKAQARQAAVAAANRFAADALAALKTTP